MGKKNATNWTSKVGKQIGFVKVLEDVGIHTKRQETLYKVQCDCGNIVVLRNGRLHSNTSCGKGCKKRGPQPFDEIKSRVYAKTSEYRRGAKRRKLLFELDYPIVEKLIDGSCKYCDETPANGIDRINPDLGYTIENSTSCCYRCNYAKLDMTEQEFYAWIKRVSSHQHTSEV